MFTLPPAIPIGLEASMGDELGKHDTLGRGAQVRRWLLRASLTIGGSITENDSTMHSA